MEEDEVDELLQAEESLLENNGGDPSGLDDVGDPSDQELDGVGVGDVDADGAIVLHLDAVTKQPESNVCVISKLTLAWRRSWFTIRLKERCMTPCKNASCKHKHTILRGCRHGLATMHCILNLLESTPLGRLPRTSMESQGAIAAQIDTSWRVGGLC